MNSYKNLLKILKQIYILKLLQKVEKMLKSYLLKYANCYIKNIQILIKLQKKRDYIMAIKNVQFLKNLFKNNKIVVNALVNGLDVREIIKKIDSQI